MHGNVLHNQNFSSGLYLHPEKFGLSYKRQPPNRNQTDDRATWAYHGFFIPEFRFFFPFPFHPSALSDTLLLVTEARLWCAPVAVSFRAVRPVLQGRSRWLSQAKPSPAPDTARQRAKAQQGQIFQTRDMSCCNHFSQETFFKLQAHILPKCVIWCKGWFALKSFFLLWIIIFTASLLWASTKVSKSILFSLSNHQPADQRPHSE